MPFVGSSLLDVNALFSLIFLPAEVPEDFSDAADRPTRRIEELKIRNRGKMKNQTHQPFSTDPTSPHASA